MPCSTVSQSQVNLYVIPHVNNIPNRECPRPLVAAPRFSVLDRLVFTNVLIGLSTFHYKFIMTFFVFRPITVYDPKTRMETEKVINTVPIYGNISI